ncbi:MAG: hypothetical protein IJ860_10425 [Eubacterium sp.]|nr:hypothetical protein [Eubacterium sp.]
MNLELTRRNLRRISELKEPAVEDVLNFIYDFCQDIKEDTGVAADKLPCHEEDAMYKRLPWMGRFVMKIGREQESVLSSDSRRERIRDITEKLGGLGQEIAKAEEQHAKLQEQKAILDQRGAALLEEKKDVLALKDEIDEIRGQIEQLEQLDLAEYASKKESLQAELRRRGLELERAKGELNAVQGEIDRRNLELVETQQKAESLQQEIAEQESLQNQISVEVKEAAEELAKKQEVSESLQAEVDSLKQETEQQNASIEDLMKERNAMQLALESEESKLRYKTLQAKQDEISQLRARLDRVRALREELLQDWNSPWGQEQRRLAGQSGQTEMPAALLQEDLDIIKKKLKQYSEGLRKAEQIMSSYELQ